MEQEHLPQDVVEMKVTAPAVLIESKRIAAAIKTNDDIQAAQVWCAARQLEINTVIERLARGKKLAYAAWQEWKALENDATLSRKDSIAIVKEAIGRVYLEIQDKEKLAHDKGIEEAGKKDEKARAKRAAQLEKQGNPELAAAVLSDSGNFVPPATEQKKPENVIVRKVWCADITNMREFIAWVNSRGNIDGEDNALIPNEDWLCSRAKMTNGAAKVPGVRFFEKPHVTLRHSA